MEIVGDKADAFRVWLVRAISYVILFAFERLKPCVCSRTVSEEER